MKIIAKPIHGLIVKSNALIRAYYRLNLWEGRLVDCLLETIKKEDTGFMTYVFKIPEIFEKYKTKTHNYGVIISAVEGLRKKQLTLTREVDGQKQIVKLSFMSAATYCENGEIELEFSPQLKPDLLQLKGQLTPYTSYSGESIATLKCGFAKRLYEISTQIKLLKYGEVFLLKDVREMFCVSNNEYKTYGDLKKRVLLPAQKELKKKSDITFVFEEIKEGRKVAALKLRTIENQSVAKTDEYLFNRIKKNFNFTDKKTQEIINEHDKEKIIIALDAVHSKKQIIKNKEGYLTTLLNTHSFGDEEIKTKKHKADKKTKDIKESKKRQQESEEADKEKIAIAKWKRENPKELKDIQKVSCENAVTKTPMFQTMGKYTQDTLIKSFVHREILKKIKQSKE